MIDLNARKSKEEKKEEEPMGLQLLLLSPFAILFWWILNSSLPSRYLLKGGELDGRS